MRADWRRQILRLPSTGELSEAAVRAAYWRLIGAGLSIDRSRIRDAKRQLLFELGVRVPDNRKRKRESSGCAADDA